MKVDEGFVLREVGGMITAVATGPASQNFHGVITLNETGKLLFELLQQGCSEQQMADRLVEEYELDSAQALADVRAFTEKLRSAGILHE